MPTERFYKLSEEKRKLIREAAIEEFSRVPFEKASINKIIQTAEISRGSFYTYFTDKRDVLGYIFEDAGEEMKETWIRCAEEKHGDLWKTAERFLDYRMTHAKDEMFRLMENIVIFQDLGKLFGKDHFDCRYHEVKITPLLQAFCASVDKTKFRKADKETVEILIRMISSIHMESMAWYYCQPENMENIKKIFRKKLEILQFGICK